MSTNPGDTREPRVKLEGELAEVVQGLEQFNPESIFLYGSRARTDHLSTSDHEVGVLFPGERYIGRSELAQAVGRPGFSIYPFELEAFMAYKPDTPFQKTIYMREVIEGGKTLAGKDVLEQLKPPEIRVLDLVEATQFNLGYALAAVMANRNDDKVSAGIEFAKSCLFSVRLLEIAYLKQFPLTYDDIHELSPQVVPPGHQEVVDAAYQARQSHSDVPAHLLFKNITLLNQFIAPRWAALISRTGNEIVLP